jgi:hypothetical protein
VAKAQVLRLLFERPDIRLDWADKRVEDGRRKIVS